MGKSLFVVVSFYIAASLFQSFSVRLRELGRFDGIKNLHRGGFVAHARDPRSQEHGVNDEVNHFNSAVKSLDTKCLVL